VAGVSILTATAVGALAGAWIAVSGPAPVLPASASDAGGLDAPREVWPKLDQPLNVVLLGIDYNGAGRGLTTDGDRTRTDTIILVRLDPQHRRISALSIPRDTRMELPGFGTDKVNAANVYGGIPLVKQTLSQFLGVPIDRHVRVNLAAAEEVMEAIGGVDLDVEREFHYDDWSGKLHVHLQPGFQHLKPKDAIAYARFRHDNQGDLGRVARQQRMLHAVADKLFQPANLLQLPKLASIARQHIDTDLSAWELTRLVGSAPELWHRDVRWGTVPGSYILYRGVSYWEPDKRATDVVVAKMFSTPPAAPNGTSKVLVLDASPREANASSDVVAGLMRQGFDVLGVRRVSPKAYPMTQVIDLRSDSQPEQLDTLKRLIQPEQTRIGDPGLEEPLSGDYVVVIGPRYRASPPPGQP
jgi:LCP family protein required for cell wall assembly